MTTILAIILNQMGLYHESNFNPKYGFLWIVLFVNVSIAFAVMVLATFYTTLKKKLEPFRPIGKFLCIKFVIFFAFWQSILIACLFHFGVIETADGYTGIHTHHITHLHTHSLLTPPSSPLVTHPARGLQDTLICGEMLLVSVAHLWTFSYRPFTVAGQRASLLQVAEALVTGEKEEEEGVLSGGERGAGGKAKVRQ